MKVGTLQNLSGSGLGGDAVVGIVLGVLFGILLLLLIGLFFCAKDLFYALVGIFGLGPRARSRRVRN